MKTGLPVVTGGKFSFLSWAPRDDAIKICESRLCYRAISSPGLLSYG